MCCGGGGRGGGEGQMTDEEMIIIKRGEAHDEAVVEVLAATALLQYCSTAK
jgi:hypothetical protein